MTHERSSNTFLLVTIIVASSILHAILSAITASYLTLFYHGLVELFLSPGTVVLVALALQFLDATFPFVVPHLELTLLDTVAQVRQLWYTAASYPWITKLSDLWNQRRGLNPTIDPLAAAEAGDLEEMRNNQYERGLMIPMSPPPYVSIVHANDGQDLFIIGEDPLENDGDNDDDNGQGNSESESIHESRHGLFIDIFDYYNENSAEDSDTDSIADWVHRATAATDSDWFTMGVTNTGELDSAIEDPALGLVGPPGAGLIASDGDIAPIHMSQVLAQLTGDDIGDGLDEFDEEGEEAMHEEAFTYNSLIEGPNPWDEAPPPSYPPSSPPAPEYASLVEVQEETPSHDPTNFAAEELSIENEVSGEQR